MMLGEGPVEADECFIGGKPKNMHRKRRLQRQVAAYGYAEKTAVFGMLERGTRQVRRLSYLRKARGNRHLE